MILNKCWREELPVFYRWEVEGLESSQLRKGAIQLWCA